MKLQLLRHASGLSRTRLPLFFYSNEGSPREPVHIHVEKNGMEAKFWIDPEISLAYNDGYDARTLRELTAMVEANQARIERAWNEFFG